MTTARSTLARSLTVLLLAGALVAAPSTAEARQYVHNDARGDLVEMSVSPREPKPDETKGDILRIRVKHSNKRIQVRVVFAELLRASDILYLTGFEFRTNEGLRRGAQIEARPENWRGFARMYGSGGAAVRCALHRSHDYVNNVAVLGFSRRCLSNPRWIRVRVSTTTAVPGDFGHGWPPLLQDDAQRTSIGPTIPNPLSPRIRRG